MKLACYFAEVAHFAHMAYVKHISLLLVFSLVSFVGFSGGIIHNLFYHFLKEHEENTV